MARSVVDESGSWLGPSEYLRRDGVDKPEGFINKLGPPVPRGALINLPGLSTGRCETGPGRSPSRHGNEPLAMAKTTPLNTATADGSGEAKGNRE